MEIDDGDSGEPVVFIRRIRREQVIAQVDVVHAYGATRTDEFGGEDVTVEARIDHGSGIILPGAPERKAEANARLIINRSDALGGDKYGFWWLASVAAND